LPTEMTMAKEIVTQSAANAGRGSLVYTLAKQINQLTADGLLVQAGLDASATSPELEMNATAYYRINGVQYSKAPDTDFAFSAAHVVTANGFGAILVQVNAAGALSTLVGEATQTTPMNYASAAEAVAALPEPSPGNIALGWVVIGADSGNWVANTNDLSTDLEPVEFVDAPTTGQIALGITFRESGDPS